MMLAWMTYSLFVGTLLAGAGALAEAVAQRMGRPSRGVWLAVIVGTLAISLAGAVSHPAASGPVTASTSSAIPPSSHAIFPIATTGIVNATSAATNTSRGLDALLLLAWCALSIVCVAILAGSAWRVSRMKRGWAEQHIAGVPVLVSHDVGPAVIGLVHHGIVVPRWIETLDAAAQDMVMTHEREHVRAGDPLLLWGASLLVAFMPWNLALWFALRGVRHAIEMDCDARVLHARPDARAYCTLLLDVGERTLAGVAPIAALAEPATMLQRRIDAMTVPRTGRSKASGAGLAAMALVLAACYAPRPEVAPSTHVAALMDELGVLLRRDSLRTLISNAERDQLAQALGPKGVPPSVMGLGFFARRDARFEGHIDPRMRARIDSVILRDYATLTTRTDTTMAIVGFVFDNAGNVRRHNARVGNVTGEAQMLFRSLGIDTLSARTSSLAMFSVKEWHTHVIVAAEDTGAVHGAPRFVGGIGLGGSEATPSERTGRKSEYGRRTDSLARALYPAAYRPLAEAMVVAAIFSSDGAILSSRATALPLKQAFDVAPGLLSPRGASYLLEETMPGEAARSDQVGSSIMRDAPHLILIAAVRRRE